MARPHNSGSDPTGAPGCDRAWYRVDEVDSCVVVTVGGEIDAATSPGLAEAVRVTTRFSRRLVIDVSEVTLLGSAGTEVLVDAVDLVRDKNGWVALVGPREAVRSVLGATEATPVLSVHDHLDDVVVAVSEQKAR